VVPRIGGRLRSCRTAGEGDLIPITDAAGFDAEIRLADPGSASGDPAALVVAHHIADRAEIRAEALSGGHLLHLAVAGCLFNDILREARARGIPVTDLRVSADGDFDGDPMISTGITYEVEIAGDAPEADLRRLVADCEAPAAIPHALRAGTTVDAGSIRVRGAS
jgi:putative redox protein